AVPHPAIPPALPYTPLFRSHACHARPVEQRLGRVEARVVVVERPHELRDGWRRRGCRDVWEFDAQRLRDIPTTPPTPAVPELVGDRKSTRLNSSHVSISYAV